MKKISILGSTGSIGTSTLDVVREHPDQLSIVALACGRNVQLLLEQIKEFKPQLVSVNSEAHAREVQRQVSTATEVLWGESGALAVATFSEANYVLSAMVGAAGLAPTYAAIQAQKEIGLANKETMVVAGEFMNAAAQAQGVKILPVDSEHSAIFQCLNGEKKSALRKIILTASGGPFLQKSKEELAAVSVEQALKHPNWDMGAKITIDSASMMNKGLELIEARWLFNVRPELLSVIVHPQSIIHSMVEFHDGSVMAQLGIPDMRIPIAYALSYPERLNNTLPALDLVKIRQLDFFKPDTEKFRCLKLAQQVLHQGGTLPAVLNAANEVAVAGFLNQKISFLQIPQVVEETLNLHDSKTPRCLEDIYEADAEARKVAEQMATRAAA